MDDLLVSMARSGDHRALEVLWNRHKERIRRIAKHYLTNKEDTEDVVSMVFIRMTAFMKYYECRNKFSGWINTITANIAKETLASQKRQQQIPRMEVATHKNAVDDYVTNKIHAEEVVRVVSSMQEQYRMPLVDFANNVSYADMAAKYDVPIGTVKSRLFQARKRFEKKWNAQEARCRLGTSQNAPKTCP